MPDNMGVHKMILKDLDEFMEEEEPISNLFLLEQDEESLSLIHI